MPRYVVKCDNDICERVEEVTVRFADFAKFKEELGRPQRGCCTSCGQTSRLKIVPSRFTFSGNF